MPPGPRHLEDGRQFGSMVGRCGDSGLPALRTAGGAFSPVCPISAMSVPIRTPGRTEGGEADDSPVESWVRQWNGWPPPPARYDCPFLRLSSRVSPGLAGGYSDFAGRLGPIRAIGQKCRISRGRADRGTRSLSTSFQLLSGIAARSGGDHVSRIMAGGIRLIGPGPGKPKALISGSAPCAKRRFHE